MERIVLDEMRRAVATGVNRPLLAYWKARFEELKTELLHCGESSYREARGRALEAEAFIKILESVKE
jgi:hypothetical protein